jgi:3-deoxy-D-manno-octulosonic-acid transferase
MIIVYNFFQTVLLFITFPLLFLIVLGKEKYRSRIYARLGRGLDKKVAGLNPDNKKIIWIHCLSVGEVTSALPLVMGIREKMDQVCVVFSASTATGMNIALKKIKPHVDLVIAAPLDLLPVTNKFVREIQPDMFILVETDFWPNWLHSLRQKDIPLVLVNGRISQSSFAKYRRFCFLFKPLFESFDLLSMQTETGAAQIRQLGVSTKLVKTLGNLKYDTNLFINNIPENKQEKTDVRIPENNLIWVCGSTHPGEEEMIITAFANLFHTRKDCFLLLAPRDPKRSKEIQKLISERGLQSMRRTCPTDPTAPILILDTIGELANCYKLARVAFIGGSLVDCGGHNPLEAAAHGVPVLFGPHMEDFLEIAEDLTKCGGAVTVDSAIKLEESVRLIFNDTTVHQQMGNAAHDLVEHNTGVISHHILELRTLLTARSGKI